MPIEIPFVEDVNKPASFTLPAWLSKDMIELTIGAIGGNFVFGFINGIITEKIPDEWGSAVKQSIAGIVDFVGSIVSYVIARKYPSMLRYGIGSSFVLFVNGTLKIVNAIWSALTGKTVIMSLDHAYAVGRAYGKTVVGKTRSTVTQSISAKPITTPEPEPEPSTGVIGYDFRSSE